MVTGTITKDNADIIIPGLDVKFSDNYTQLGTNMTFYGQGGAGKTTLPSCLADTEFAPVFFMASESGISVVQNLHLPYTDMAKWTDIDKLLNALKGPNPPKIKSLVLDNLSEMLNICIHHVAPSGQPTQPEWNKITNLMLSMVRDFRDLTKNMDLNVFFLAWDSDERDELQAVKKDINFTPALRKAFPGIVDTVGHIAVLDRRPDMRKISFAPSPKTIAKFRRAPTANARKIPFEIYYTLDNLPLADVLRTMKSDAEWPAAKYPVPNAA